jgi:hypothetical protein
MGCEDEQFRFTLQNGMIIAIFMAAVWVSITLLSELVNAGARCGRKVVALLLA